MGRHDIPDRWLDYKPIGNPIEGTRFIAFKVPLEQHIAESVEDTNVRLDTKTLLQYIPNLGLIIDLTNTNRYYNPKKNFEQKGIEHVKIMVPGHTVPDLKYRNVFKEAVNEFLKINHDNDKLIGVHCTHGVNRTGFLICNYMVREMNIEPNDALQRFAIARGHPIERDNYKQFISANTLEESYNDSSEEFSKSKRDMLEMHLTNKIDWRQNESGTPNSKYTFTTSWRKHEPPPLRTETLTRRDYEPSPNYQRIGDQYSSHCSLRRSLVNLCSSSRETFSNGRYEAQNPYNYLPHYSNQPPINQFSDERKSWRSEQNQIEPLNYTNNQGPINKFNEEMTNWRSQEQRLQRTAPGFNNRAESSDNRFTARHDNNFMNSREAYRNNSKPNENFNTRFRRSYREKYHNNPYSNFDSNTMTKRSVYRNSHNSNNSKYNNARKDFTQRTSMLDDLY